MDVLLAKLLLAPLCVVAVSLAGRRWGVATAGILGGLPVVAGPILVVLTLVHGRSFGADAAAGTLLGLVALTTFVVVYGRASERLGPTACMLVGWFAFFAAVAVLKPLHPGPELALLVVAVVFQLGLLLLPPPAVVPPAMPPMPWWDLPARAGAALALVLAITTASGSLGADLSGLLAPFPVITTVLAVFTHGHGGSDQVRVLLRNFLVGFYGYAAFCFVLAVALPSVAGAAAFALALLATALVQAAVFVISIRRRPQPQPQ